ncbi:hypothetical protein HRbin27_00059 [bacterium HR27]|nr:hypothetical protein HRbin27_00059 [bacterium HR27]
MAAIVARIRDLVGDSGPDPVWSDDEIERFADAVAIVGAQVQLDPVGPLPTTTWRTLVAPWELGARLYDAAGNQLAVATDRGTSGVWETAAAIRGPVWVLGNLIDVYLAAASLLDAWAAREKASYDVEVAGDTRLSRSQKVSHLLELAARYRSQAWPRVSAAGRTDLEGVVPW